MTITLTPEIESRLRDQAEHIGEDANHLAEELIAQGLSNGDDLDDPDDLTTEQIAEIRAGIKRGLESAAAGRVKSSAQAVAEARQRQGFSSRACYALCKSNGAFLLIKPISLLASDLPINAGG
ncbi:MAG: hypothetical protein ACRYFS_17920, partial [Janthinobacterium lividum]